MPPDPGGIFFAATLTVTEWQLAAYVSTLMKKWSLIMIFYLGMAGGIVLGDGFSSLDAILDLSRNQRHENKQEKRREQRRRKAEHRRQHEHRYNDRQRSRNDRRAPHQQKTRRPQHRIP